MEYQEKMDVGLEAYISRLFLHADRKSVSSFFKMINIDHSLKVRAVFSWVSKVTSYLLWFYLYYAQWLVEKSPATFSTNQKYNQNQSWVLRAPFPVICELYGQSLRVLTGLLDCLCPLWLAKVITLALVWKLAQYLEMNAVLSRSFSRHGIGIRHTLILYDKGIPQLGEGTMGPNRLTTTTASTATIYLLATLHHANRIIFVF